MKEIEMKELGDALRILLAKISDFFDILDLSFLISGAAFVGAFYFLGRVSNLSILAFLTRSGLLTLIVLCYISGLICFALGRWLRNIFSIKYEEKFKTHFLEVLSAHQLDKELPFKPYLKSRGHGDLSRLYVRLWAEIRQNPTLSPSFSLIRRYWVMAATYDGLAFAVLSWIIMISFARFFLAFSLSLTTYILIMILLVFAVYACMREARRNQKHQVEELVASITVSRNKF
ncbi:hypothetical protein JW964_02465 [candidate division KSB1 bacterium]|nr:hypothetical protein [candidate division KSB1 bacterium]